MNLKNVITILSLLSIELKVFASPLNDIIPEEETSVVETLNAEVSDDAFETVNVDSATAIEDANADSDSDEEIPDLLTDIVSDSEELWDLPCDDFYSCMDWVGENKEMLGYSDEFIQYMITQYEAGKGAELVQQYEAINYGIKVDVNGHLMNVDIQGEGNDKTIVVLNGLGMPSPILFYKDVAESLSTDFKVITIEPFGYGLSDQVSEERTVENIVSEIHTCLQKLGIQQYYLMGHSIGGLNSLVFDNKYPEEVLGFIGLDNEPNNFVNEDIAATPNALIPFIRIAYKYQFLELYPEEANNDVQLLLAMLNMYQIRTEEDLKNIETIIKYTYYSPNVVNESDHINDNIAYTNGMRFNCPALMFLATENTDKDERWESLHQAMIADPDHSEVIVVESTHAFIFTENKEFITNKIKEWIN